LVAVDWCFLGVLECFRAILRVFGVGIIQILGCFCGVVGLSVCFGVLCGFVGEEAACFLQFLGEISVFWVLIVLSCLFAFGYV